MPNDYFEFKQFTVWQSSCPQKVSTDASIFGAWAARFTKPAARVLDIGAGTGLLMLMLAQQNDGLIDGIEIDADCVKQLRENLQKSKWAKRLQAIEGNVKEQVLPSTYDLIISNPPFYEHQLTSPDQRKNLAWHSSALGLEELFDIAGPLLNHRGEFGLILPYSRKDELLQYASASAFHPSRTLSVRHTLDHPFTRIMIIFSKVQTPFLEEDLEIKTREGEYTDAMKSLLADYYLFL